MSEISQEYSKDGAGPISELGQVLGTGSGINTGQDGVTTGLPSDTIAGGIGNTFLTEPLHAEFVKLLEEASFVRQIAKTVTMTQPTLRVPAITSGLEVYYHGEQGQEANETTMSAGDFTLEARKIMAQVIATAELYEDSQQNIEQIITGDFVRAIAQAEEQAFLLGRITAVGDPAKGSLTDMTPSSATPASIAGLTQFIRHTSLGSDTFTYNHWGTVDGSTLASANASTQPIKSSPLNICDGVVTVGLDEGNWIDMGGASFRGGTAYKAVREAIFRLGLLGRDRGQLVLVLNPVASNQLLQSDELMTLDKYGANATILTGEVGSLFGVKIIESSFLPSNGVTVAGDTLASVSSTWGLGGYGVLVHKPSLLLGDLRKVQVENERIIQNDAYRTVISERLAFAMERRNASVVIGNIASSVSELGSGSSVFIAGGLAPTLSGPSAINLAKEVGETGSVTISAENLDVGESYTITASTYVAGDDNTNTNLAHCIIDLAITGGLTHTEASITAGETVTISGASTTGVASIVAKATVTTGAFTVGDTFTMKLALFDGSQYSNVHTIVVTATS